MALYIIKKRIFKRVQRKWKNNHSEPAEVYERKTKHSILLFVLFFAWVAKLLENIIEPGYLDFYVTFDKVSYGIQMNKRENYRFYSWKCTASHINKWWLSVSQSIVINTLTKNG